MPTVKARRIRQPKIRAEHAHGRLVFSILLVLLALGGWGYLAFDLANGNLRFDLAESPALDEAEIAALASARAKLKEETEALEQRLQSLTEDHQDEAQAVRDAQETIRQLQAENTSLRSQVAFLTQLFGGDDGPIEISDLELSSASDNAVRYWFKVSRTSPAGDMLTGQALLQVRGRYHGEEHYFDLAELTPDAREGHKLGFRQFQEIDGTLTLPDGFTPDELLVIIVPDDKETGGARRHFKWLIDEPD